jgi:hypothetical protein
MEGGFKMKSKYNFVQVYNVWVNGRDKNDVDQHFPVNNNLDRNWHTDFKQAAMDYFKAKVRDCEGKFGLYSEIYQDYIVTLYSFEVEPVKFKEKFGLEFDLSDEQVQELVPYYVDYNFNTVAERISKFKRR